MTAQRIHLCLTLAALPLVLSVQCRRELYQTNDLRITLRSSTSNPDVLLGTCSSEKHVSFVLNVASQPVLSPSLKDHNSHFAVPVGVSAGVPDIAVGDSACFREAVKWLLPSEDCPTILRSSLDRSIHNFKQNVETPGLPSMQYVLQVDPELQYTSHVAWNVVAPAVTTSDRPDATGAGWRCLNRKLKEKLRLLLDAEDKVGNAILSTENAVVTCIQLKLNDSVLTWTATVETDGGSLWKQALEACSTTKIAGDREQPLPRVKVDRVLRGTGQHRKLETALEWVTKPGDNCDVAIVDLLPHTMFTDADEFGAINDLNLKSNSSVRFSNYHPVNIEHPAEEADEAAVAQTFRVAKKPEMNSRNIVSVPIHLRYQAPDDARNDGPQGFAPVSIFPPQVSARCNGRGWVPVLIVNATNRLKEDQKGVIWKLYDKRTEVFTIFAPIGPLRHMGSTLSCSALFAALACGVIMVLTIGPIYSENPIIRLN